MDKLVADWDVTDKGPMEDLLGIEIEYNSDGSVKLHQRKYIEKVRWSHDKSLPVFLIRTDMHTCKGHWLPIRTNH